MWFMLAKAGKIIQSIRVPLRAREENCRDSLHSALGGRKLSRLVSSVATARQLHQCHARGSEQGPRREDSSICSLR